MPKHNFSNSSITHGVRSNPSPKGIVDKVTRKKQKFVRKTTRDESSWEQEQMLYNLILSMQWLIWFDFEWKQGGKRQLMWKHA